MLITYCKDIETLEGGGVNRVLKLFRPNGKLSDFNSLSLGIV